MQLDLLHPYLEAHPDQAYAAYIAEGLRNGFRIGFHHESVQLKSRRTNHPSCRSKPEVVCERIAAELSAGRLLGPIAPELQLKPMGLVPKPHQPNKFRLIVDQTTPANRSVNDGIPRDLCSLKYASVDEAVAIIRTLGRGTRLVKIDLKDAYRLIPVHHDDYHLLGVSWDGHGLKLGPLGMLMGTGCA